MIYHSRESDDLWALLEARAILRGDSLENMHRVNAVIRAQIADDATGKTGRAQARSGSADAGETAPSEVGDVGGEGREAGSGAEDKGRH